ncbi:hypothetical protein DB346_10315 [Verrucomicrobia bacterium LW23]|nr:hypothetical protein DB346_10315 [Verrucomicrobia bacterium LW23]
MSFLSWINRDQLKDLLNRSGFPEGTADPATAQQPMLPGAMPVPLTVPTQRPGSANPGQFRPLTSPPMPAAAPATQMVRPGGSTIIPGLPTDDPVVGEDPIVGEAFPEDPIVPGTDDPQGQAAGFEAQALPPAAGPAPATEGPIDPGAGATLQLHAGSRAHPRLVPRPAAVPVSVVPGKSSGATPPQLPGSPKTSTGSHFTKIGIAKPPTVPTPAPTRTGSIKIPAKSGDTSQLGPSTEAARARRIGTGRLPGTSSTGGTGKLPLAPDSTKLKPKSGDTSKLPKVDKSSLRPKSGDTSKITLPSSVVTTQKMPSAKLPTAAQVAAAEAEARELAASQQAAEPITPQRPVVLRKSMPLTQSGPLTPGGGPALPPKSQLPPALPAGEKSRRPFLPNVAPLTAPDTKIVPISEQATQPMRPRKPEVPSTQKVGVGASSTGRVTRGPFPSGVKPPPGVPASSIKDNSTLQKGSTQRIPSTQSLSANADMLRQVRELEANFDAMLERARVAEDKCTGLQNELEAYRIQIQDTEEQLATERQQREELAEIAANLRAHEEQERARLAEDERRLAEARAELEGTAESFQKERLELNNARLMLREMETNNKRLARQLEVRAKEAERASALIEELKARLETETREIDALRKAAQEANEALARDAVLRQQIEAEHEQLKLEVEHTAAESLAREQKIAELQDEMRARLEELDQERARGTELEKSLEKMREQQAESHSALLDYQQRLATARDLFERTRQELDSERADFSKKMREISATPSEPGVYDNGVGPDRSADRRELESRLAALEAALEASESRRVEAVRTCEELEKARTEDRDVLNQERLSFAGQTVDEFQRQFGLAEVFRQTALVSEPVAQQSVEKPATKDEEAVWLHDELMREHETAMAELRGLRMQLAEREMDAEKAREEISQLKHEFEAKNAALIEARLQAEAETRFFAQQSQVQISKSRNEQQAALRVVAEKDAELSLVRSQLEARLTESAQLQQDLDKLREGQSAEAESGATALQARIAELLGEVGTLSARRDELQVQSGQLGEMLEQKTQEVVLLEESLKQEKERLQGEVDRLSAQIATLEPALNSAVMRADTSAAEVLRLQDECAQRTRELEQLRAAAPVLVSSQPADAQQDLLLSTMDADGQAAAAQRHMEEANARLATLATELSERETALQAAHLRLAQDESWLLRLSADYDLYRQATAEAAQRELENASLPAQLQMLRLEMLVPYIEDLIHNDKAAEAASFSGDASLLAIASHMDRKGQSLQSLEGEIEKARSEIEERERKWNTLHAEHSQMLAAVGLTASDLDERSRRVEAVQSELAQREAELEQLRQDALNIRSERDELADRLNASREALEAERDKLLQEQNRLSETHARLQEANDALGSEAGVSTNLRNRLEASEKEVAATEGRLSELLQRYESQVGESAQAAALAETLRERLEAAASEHNALMEQLEGSRKALDAERQQLMSARSLQERSGKHLEFVNQTLDFEVKHSKNLTGQLAEKAALLLATEARVAQGEAKVVDLESQLVALQTRFDEESRRTSEGEALAKDLQDKLEALGNERDALTRSLDNARSDLALEREHMLEEQARMTASTTHVQSLSEAMEAEHAKARELRSDISAMESQIVVSQARLADLLQKYTSEVQQAAQTSELASSLSAELEGVRAERDALAARLKESQAALDQEQLQLKEESGRLEDFKQRFRNQVRLTTESGAQADILRSQLLTVRRERDQLSARLDETRVSLGTERQRLLDEQVRIGDLRQRLDASTERVVVETDASAQLRAELEAARLNATETEHRLSDLLQRFDAQVAETLLVSGVAETLRNQLDEEIARTESLEIQFTANQGRAMSLLEQVQARQQEVEAAATARITLEAEAADLTKRLNHALADAAAVRDLLVEAEASIVKLTGHRDELLETISQHQDSQHRTASAPIHGFADHFALVQFIEDKMRDADAVAHDLHSSREDLSRQVEATARLQTVAADIAADLEAAQSRIGDAESEIAWLKQECEAAGGRVADRDRQVEALRLTCMNVEGQLAEAREEIRRREADLAKRQLQIQHLEAESHKGEEARRVEGVLRAEITELRREVDEANYKSAGLRDQLYVFESEMDVNRRAIREAQAEAAAAHTALASLHKVRDALQSQFTLRSKEATDARQQMDAAHEALRERTAAAERLRQELSVALESLTVSEQRLSELEESNTRFALECSAATTTAAEKTSALDLISGQLAEARIQLENKHSENETLSRLADEYKQQDAVNKFQIADLQKTLARVHADFEKAKHDLEHERLELTDTRESLRKVKADAESLAGRLESEARRSSEATAQLRDKLRAEESRASQLAQEAAEARASLAEQRQALQQVRDESAKLRAELADRARASEDQARRLAALEEAAKGTSVDAEVLRKRLEEKELEVERRNAELLALQEALRGKEGEVSSGTSNLLALQETLRLRESELSSGAISLQEAQASLAAREKEAAAAMEELRKKEAEISQRMQELEQAQLAESLLRANNQELAGRISAMEEEAKRSSAFADELKNELESLRQSYDIARNDLMEAHAAVEGTRAPLQALESRREQLEAELEAAKAEHGKVQLMAQDLRGQLDTAIATHSTDIDAVRAQLRDKEAEVTAKLSDLQAAQDSLRSKDDEIATAREEQARREEAAAGLRRTNEELSGRIASLEETSRVSSESAAALTSQLEELKQMLEAAKVQLADANSAHETTRKAHQSAEEQRVQLAKDLEAAKLQLTQASNASEVTRLQLVTESASRFADLQALTADIESLRDELRQRETESNERHAQLVAAQEALKQKEAENAERQAELQKLAETLRTREQEISDRAGEVQTVRNELITREQELESGRVEQRRKDESEAALRRANEELLVRISALESEAASSSTAVTSLRDELARLTAGLEARSSELSNARSQADQSAATVADLESRRSQLEADLQAARAMHQEAATLAEALRAQLSTDSELRQKLDAELEAARAFGTTHEASLAAVKQKLEHEAHEAARLRDELRTVSENAEALAKAKERLEADEAARTASLREQQAKLGALEAEKESHLRDLTTAREQLQARENELEQLRLQEANARAQATASTEVAAARLAGVHHEKETLSQEVYTLRDSLSQSQGKSDELQREIDKLRVALQGLVPTDGKSIREAFPALATLDNLPSELSEAREFKSAAEVAEHAGRFVRFLTSTVAAEESELTRIRAELAAAREAAMTHEQRRTEVEAKAAAESGELARLRESLMRAMESNAAKDTTLQTLSEKLQTQENTIGELRAELSALQSQLAEKTALVAKLEHELTSAREMAAAVSASVPEFAEATGAAESDDAQAMQLLSHEELVGQVGLLRAENRRALHNMSALRHQIGRLETTLEAVRRDYNQAVEDREYFKARASMAEARRY